MLEQLEYMIEVIKSKAKKCNHIKLDLTVFWNIFSFLPQFQWFVYVAASLIVWQDKFSKEQ